MNDAHDKTLNFCCLKKNYVQVKVMQTTRKIRKNLRKKPKQDPYGMLFQNLSPQEIHVMRVSGIVHAYLLLLSRFEIIMQAFVATASGKTKVVDTTTYGPFSCFD